MRTGNPVLHGQTFTSAGRVFARGREGVLGEGMTIMGTVNKTYVLLVLLVVTAAWVWGKAMAQEPVGLYLVGGAIGGLVVALVTVLTIYWGQSKLSQRIDVRRGKIYSDPNFFSALRAGLVK